MKKKVIATDLLYCIVAVGIMNLVLQVVVYPVYNSVLGANGFGDIIFMISIINIIGPAFGLGVNNTRLVFPNRDNTQNKDYMDSIWGFSIISGVVAAVIACMRGLSIFETIVFVYVIVVSIIRNYACVEYRLSLNYKKQMKFYGVLSLGYILGLVIFKITMNGYFVFAIGETAAIIYVVITGDIFKGKGRSIYRNKIFKNSVLLSGSYILTYLMCNLDKFVLLYCVGSEAVSQYYVVSLWGKTIAIISGPVNSIVIGYMSKDGEKVSEKLYAKIMLLLSAIGVVAFVACSVVTPIYIKIFYPNLYSATVDLNLIVNAAQILYFVTNTLLVVILTMCSAKWQLIIQGVYSILFVVLSFALTMQCGVEGFSIAALISSAVYFVITFLVGYICVKKRK